MFTVMRPVLLASECLAALSLAAAAGVPPASRAAEPVPCEYPVEIAGQVILVRTTVNGQGPFSFILDSGATETVVTPPAARRAGIAVGGGLAGMVAVGETAVTNLPVLVMDPPQALSLRLDNLNS